MKNVVMFLMALGFGFQAMGAEVDPTVDAKPLTVTKTKITCYADSRYVLVDKSGKETVYEDVGMISESIRQTVSDGKMEYRFSDFKGFNPDGTSSQAGHSITKFQTARKGNTVTEKSDYKVVSYRTDSGTAYENGSRFNETNEVTEATFEVNGDKRTLIKLVVNGQQQPTHGQEITEIVISDTEKVQKFVDQTPYIEDRDAYKLRVEKSEMTCTYKTMK